MRHDPRSPAAAELPMPAAGEPPLPYVPQPERRALPNGMRVVATRWGVLPQIVLRLVLPAGAVRDPNGGPGTAGLVGRLLTEGTELYDAASLNTRLDQLGASVEVHVGHDFAEVELLLLSETIDETLPLLAELVTRPTFPHRETERARHEVLDALAARDDEPANVADDRAAAAVFDADHPYGRPALGTRTAVAALRRERLAEFHDRLYRPEGSLLVAAGDFDVERLIERVQHAFRDWTGAPAAEPIPAVSPRPLSAGERLTLPWKDAQQAELRVAGVGLRRSSADWIAAAVANYILGGSTITGRLGANLREDRGWTYGARSSFSAGLEPGGWMAEAAVDSAVREPALAEMAAEIRRMVEEPVPDDELARAQEALVLSLPRAFETPGRAVSRFVTVEAFGLPDDYWERFPAAVRSVTAAEVRRVSQRCFGIGDLVTVSVG